MWLPGGEGPTFKSAESRLVQWPTGDNEQNVEDQKPDVPRKRPTKIVPHVMGAKYLMVDQPSTTLKMPQPVRTSPKWKVQFGARRPCRQAVIAAMEAARTSTQVAK
jgi:hypothetical protein